MDQSKQLGFLFSDANQHSLKRPPNGPGDAASKRPKPEGGDRPHKKTSDGHVKSAAHGTKHSHHHKPSAADKKKPVSKVKRPVIEDSDDDDEIDGNLFSRKSNSSNPPQAQQTAKPVPPTKPKDVPSDKPKSKKPSAKVKSEMPMESSKSPAVKLEAKVKSGMVKIERQNSAPSKNEARSKSLSAKPVDKTERPSSAKPEVKSERPPPAKHNVKKEHVVAASKVKTPSSTPKPVQKKSPSTAGTKRQHQEDSDDELSDSLPSSDSESSDEPLAMGLNSDSDNSSSDDYGDFKTSKSQPKAKVNRKQTTPKPANKKKADVKKVEKKKATPAVTKTPAKKTSGTPVKKEGDGSPQKKKKKEEERVVRKWWEEEKLPEGIKWKTLEHKGPYFPPLYEPLPKHVKFLYDGKPVSLTPDTEEIAGFFGKMLDHDYTQKDIFVQNFWNDWRKVMSAEEAKLIRDFRKCDFSQINQYYKDKSEARKQMTKEEKLKQKEENEQIIEEYGWALMDGHKERIGNFKIEPPGLFRGRGDHPKQGMIKKRVQPEDVTINIGKDAKVPDPPAGHKWKAVSRDNSVTWLASWTENIQGQIKYVMLNPTSRIKGEKDWMKYETARKLKNCVDNIRKQYYEDLKSKEMRIRQRATALYFIDKLALRAGNEKDPDESADTVGCCSLRVEHIKLHEVYDGEECVVEFDFLGKDSIRYQNHVSVDKQVFKNLRLFTKGKDPSHDLFDRLSTSDLNKHLQELMEGLTAKVFRTYNASNTLQEQLGLLTVSDDNMPAKMLSYNRANRAVAVLCNHQRAPPKTFDQQMENLQKKIDAKKDSVKDAEKELKDVKKGGDKKKAEVAKKKVERLKDQLHKLELQATDKEENKEIALGTSKLNYLDPRISVSWCKKWDVPVEKVYNKTQRQKFAWAIDMADETFAF